MKKVNFVALFFLAVGSAAASWCSEFAAAANEAMENGASTEMLEDMWNWYDERC